MPNNFDVIRAGIRVLQKGITHYDKKDEVTRTADTINRSLNEIERELEQVKADYAAQIQWGADAP